MQPSTRAALRIDVFFDLREISAFYISVFHVSSADFVTLTEYFLKSIKISAPMVPSGLNYADLTQEHPGLHFSGK